MCQTLRIIFCILAVGCLAAAIPIGAVFGWQYLIGLLAGAALFAALMFLMKNTPWKNKKTAKPDYMNTKEENTAIARQNAQEKSDGQSE